MNSKIKLNDSLLPINNNNFNFDDCVNNLEEETIALNTLKCDGVNGSMTIPENVQSTEGKSFSNKSELFSPLFRQSFAAFGTILFSLSIGTGIGYSAILLPQIQDEKKYNFTAEHQSWIASVATLPMAPTCILGGILMEIVGRKIPNILLSIPFLLGWILIYNSNGFQMFFWGRLMQGISLGLSGPLNSVFIGETTDTKYRGIFLVGISLGYTFGILFTHLIGTYYRWPTTALICATINILTLSIFIIVPESPSFLINKGKIKEAREAFEWFRGDQPETINEFNEMLKNQKERNILDFMKNFKEMRQPSFYKPFLILLGMFFVLQFVGINVLAFYTVSIMKKAADNLYNEYMATILIDAMRFFISIITCLAVGKFPRKQLFIISGLGTGICLVALSILLYTTENTSYLKKFPYLSLILILGYISFSSLGLLPLPWCLIGEIFPSNLRGIGSGLASASNFLFLFIVVKMASFLFATIGLEGSFFVYGCIGLIGTIFLYKYLPETRNKTLQEIEDIFKSKQIKIDNSNELKTIS